MIDENAIKWSKTEDKILIKSIRRYGVFRWDKVASLIKKDAKECYLRARILLSDITPEIKNQIITLFGLFSSQYELISEQTGVAPEICYEIIAQKCLGNCESKTTNKLNNNLINGTEYDIDQQLKIEMAEERLARNTSRKKIKKGKSKPKPNFK